MVNRTVNGQSLIKSATAVAAACVISACGGGGVTGEPVSGKLIDGYISGAKVCLDMNGNGACDAGEPSGVTGADGSWELYAAQGTDLSNYYVIADIPSSGAYDSDAPSVELAASKMMALASDGSVISPLTTVVAGFVKEGFEPDEAKDKARALIGLPEDYDFSSDHVAKADAQAHAAAKIINAALTNAIGSDALVMTKLKLAIANSIENAKLAYSSPSSVESLLEEVDVATSNLQPVYNTVADIDMAKFIGYGIDGPPFRARYLPKYESGPAYAGYAIYSDEWGAGLQYSNFTDYSATINGVTKLKFDVYVADGSTDFNTLYVNTNNPYYGHGNEVSVDVSTEKGGWVEHEVTLDAVWDDDNMLTFRSGAPGYSGPLADFAIANVRISNDDWSTSDSISADQTGWGHWSVASTYPESYSVPAGIVARGDVIKGIKTNDAAGGVGMTASDFANGLTGSSQTVQLDVFSDGLARPVQVYFQASGANGWQDTSSKVTVTPSAVDAWETLTAEVSGFKAGVHTVMVVILDPEEPGGDQVAYFSNFKVVSVANPFE